MFAATGSGRPQSREERSVLVDRSMGKMAAKGLAVLGLHPVWIGEVYTNDAKLVPDVVWIHEAAQRGYPVITKDRTIWVNVALEYSVC